MPANPEPRINLVTLGVRDLAAATAFYQRLGWRKAEKASAESVSFFMLGGGLVLSLFGRAELAADAALPEAGSGFGGITLAYLARSEAQADAVAEAFVAAGGTLLKKPQTVFWGGYSGYVADLDGHPWEIAFNPFWPLDGQGRAALPS